MLTANLTFLKTTLQANKICLWAESDFHTTNYIYMYVCMLMLISIIDL